MPKSLYSFYIKTQAKRFRSRFNIDLVLQRASRYRTDVYPSIFLSGKLVMTVVSFLQAVSALFLQPMTMAFLTVSCVLVLLGILDDVDLILGE